MTLFIGQFRFEALKMGDQLLAPVLDGYRSQISNIQTALDGYSRSTTKESLVFNVDYNLPGALRVLPNTTFIRQREIDGYLQAGNSTAFQYLQDVWDSLPPIVAHTCVINLSTGVHRPRNPEINLAAWTLTGKMTIAPAVIVLQGADGYTQVCNFRSITSVQAASSDPYVDVSGSAFTADGYRGLFAIFSTGQRTVIHANPTATPNRLYLTNNVSPATPTAVAIYRPGTILRNSYTDTVRAKATTTTIGGLETPMFININDLQLDAFNTNSGISTSTLTRLSLTRFLIDHAYVRDTFGVTDAGRGIQPAWQLTLSTSSLRGTFIATSPTSSSTDAIFCSTSPTRVSISNSYVGGWRDIAIQESIPGPPLLSLTSAIIDKCWSTIGTIQLFSSKLFFQDLTTGPVSTIRNATGAGLYLYNTQFALDAGGQTFDLKFESVTGPCIQLVKDSMFSLENGTGLGAINGASSNSNVGVSLLGPNCKLILNSVSNVNGTLGDVRLADGSIRSYTDINTLGPYIDVKLNYVEKL